MQIHDIVKKHTIGDGLDIIVDLDKSQGSWIHDAKNDCRYLDCYSQFASQPIGWNHPKMEDYILDLGRIARVKLANSDLYSKTYADFLEAFSDITPDFSKYFFIDGGTLGVENALKCAIDWKARKEKLDPDQDFDYVDIVHLKEAFHGRSGYTMSLTNTLPVKTHWYPKHQWTRIINPKTNCPVCPCAEMLEGYSLDQAEAAMKRGVVAAIILEAIQGEGGDNHFRPEYLQALRKLADKYEALLIIDEVQTGVGLTGKMWSYEHFGVVPDLIAFGKKTQVCGFCSTGRIDDVDNVFTVSSRINSTWGGNIVDMARFIVYKKIIEEENLVQNARLVGAAFKSLLDNISGIKNVRGRGLMLAFDLENTERRNQVWQKLFDNGLLALKCGQKSIRLRPHLDFTYGDAGTATGIIATSL